MVLLRALTVAAVCCSCMLLIASGHDTASPYTLKVNERGTKFTERIDIDGQNTLIFHVPSHNDVDQSDILIDYEKKLSVTRIPRIKECHMEKLEEDDESSPEKVLMDIAKLKLIYKGIPKSIRTIQKTVIKVGKVQARSPRIIKFCGSYPIFKMAVLERRYSDDKQKGRRVQKRSIPARRNSFLGRLENRLESMAVASMKGEPTQGPSVDDIGDDDDDDTGSGTSSGDSASGNSASGNSADVAALAGNKYYDYYTSSDNCHPIENYDLRDCAETPNKWNLTAVQTSHSCVYQVKCSGMEYNADRSCNEEHIRSSSICYDLSCKSSFA